MIFPRKVYCLIPIGFYVCFGDLLYVHVLCIYGSASAAGVQTWWDQALGDIIRLWELSPDSHAAVRSNWEVLHALSLFMCFSAVHVEMTQGTGYFFFSAWQRWQKRNTLQAASRPLLLSLGSNTYNGWLNFPGLGKNKDCFSRFFCMFFLSQNHPGILQHGSGNKIPNETLLQNHRLFINWEIL